MENKWLLQKEAAKFLGISSSTLYKWVDKGILESHARPGRYEKFFNINELKKIKAKRHEPIVVNKQGPKPKKLNALSQKQLPPKLKVSIEDNQQMQDIIDKFSYLNGKIFQAVQNHDKAIEKLNNTSKLIIDLINTIAHYLKAHHENTHSADNR